MTHLEIVQPDWSMLDEKAMDAIRRALAMAVIDADRQVTTVTAQRDASANGDSHESKARSAAYSVFLLVAQQDLIGRCVLLMSAMPEEEAIDVHTIEGILVRASLYLLDQERP